MKIKLKCILLIDDDTAVNFYNRIILEESGWADNIKIVQSVIAGIDYLIESDHLTYRDNSLIFPDLIFLDVNMPALDGWEFMELYKNIKGDLLKTPKIIMFSTLLDIPIKQRAMAIQDISGVYDKPLTPEVIHSIISIHFPHLIE